MFFVLSRAWEKIVIPQEESNLKLSDSALLGSTTEPLLYGERGLLRGSYGTRPAYC